MKQAAIKRIIEHSRTKRQERKKTHNPLFPRLKLKFRKFLNSVIYKKKLFSESNDVFTYKELHEAYSKVFNLESLNVQIIIEDLYIKSSSHDPKYDQEVIGKQKLYKYIIEQIIK